MENQPKNIEDFLDDNSFRKWAIENSEEETKQWAEFLKQNPAQKDTFKKAAILFRYFKNPNIDAVPPQIVKQQWQQFRAISFEKEGVPLPPISIRSSSFWRVAAAILLVGGLALWQNTHQTEVVARKGTLRQVLLPDGSLVHLNANATLRYPTFWWFRQERNVLLIGNAYFEVQKAQSSFVVHTDKFEVKVLGTKFEVNTLPNKEKVYLNEGSVAIGVPSQKQLVRLAPNQIFSFKNKSEVLVETNRHYHGHDWIVGKLTFENKTLEEVAEQIHDLYGVELLFPVGASQKRFSASLPYTTTVAPVVAAIAQSFNFEVKRIKDTTIEFYER